MKEEKHKKLIAILKILKELDGGSVNTSKLAKDLDVSKRSVQRYINTIDEAGFPIYQESPGIYKFSEGFTLKSADTTRTEISMLVFLSDIVKSLGKDFEKSFNSIKQKVLFPKSESPFYIKMPKTKGYERTEVSKCIETAIENHKIIDISYQNIDGDIKEYRLQPYKIVNYEGFWYLYALKNGTKRTFKLNNIKSCKVSKTTFKPLKSIIKKLDESVNIWFELDKKIKVRMSVDKEVAEFFKAKEYFPNQKIIKVQKNGNLIIETTIGRYEEITPTIFSWIPFVKVISPVKLNEHISGKIKKFIKVQL